MLAGRDALHDAAAETSGLECALNAPGRTIRLRRVEPGERRRAAAAGATSNAYTALQHDLAARLAAFQQRMCTRGGFRRVIVPKALVKGGAQRALVDQIGDVVQKTTLLDHVRRLERGRVGIEPGESKRLCS